MAGMLRSVIGRVGRSIVRRMTEAKAEVEAEKVGGGSRIKELVRVVCEGLGEKKVMGTDKAKEFGCK